MQSANILNRNIFLSQYDKNKISEIFNGFGIDMSEQELRNILNRNIITQPI